MTVFLRGAVAIGTLLLAGVVAFGGIGWLAWSESHSIGVVIACELTAGAGWFVILASLWSSFID